MDDTKTTPLDDPAIIPPQNESTVNTDRHLVPDDTRIEPDTDLQGYQEDIDVGGGSDEPQREQDTTPEEYLQMPQAVLKEELDKTAMTEQEYSHEVSEDMREHIEDMDEADKNDRP